MKTHRGATWPTVASRSDRMQWVAEILRDEGIKVKSSGRLWIAMALLQAIYHDDLKKKAERIAAIEAAIPLERLWNKL